MNNAADKQLALHDRLSHLDCAFARLCVKAFNYAGFCRDDVARRALVKNLWRGLFFVYADDGAAALDIDPYPAKLVEL